MSNLNQFLEKSMICVVLFGPKNMDMSPSSMFRDTSTCPKSTSLKEAGILPVSTLCDRIRYKLLPVK